MRRALVNGANNSFKPKPLRGSASSGVDGMWKAFVFVLLLSGCSRNQDSPLPITEYPGWSIRGTVIDVDKNASAKDVELTLLRSQRPFPFMGPKFIVIARTKTNAAGAFEFSSQIKGNFYIHMSRSGYCSSDTLVYPLSMAAVGVKQISKTITQKHCRLIY